MLKGIGVEKCSNVKVHLVQEWDNCLPVQFGVLCIVRFLVFSVFLHGPISLPGVKQKKDKSASEESQ
jgi:hypothetical protein